MKLRRPIISVLATLICVISFAQQTDFEVDYNNPRKFIVGGISVEGDLATVSAQQIIQLTGLSKGMEVTIPGDDLNSIVDRLWAQNYFDDVALLVDSLSTNRDSAYLKVSLKERPRVSEWTFTGVKSSEKKDLQERLNLKRGGSYSEYVEQTAKDIIRRYYSEKGFLKATITPEVKKDSVIRNAIRVNFAVDKGDRVRVKDINFIGGDDIKEYKLAKSMKKTKSSKWYNFFHSKKFNEKEYPNDKNGLISAMNEAGYRDARIVKDSIYYIEPSDIQGCIFDYCNTKHDFNLLLT